MICQYCGKPLQSTTAGDVCQNPACPGRLRREEMSEKKVHYLKTWPEPFRAVVAGIKRADFRLNDRDYHVGDTIVLEEFEPDNCGYTGKQHTVTITHIQDGFGIPDGYVMLSIDTPASAEVEDLLDHIISAANSVSIPSESNYLNELKSRLLAALSNKGENLSGDVKVPVEELEDGKEYYMTMRVKAIATGSCTKVRWATTDNVFYHDIEAQAKQGATFRKAGE